MLTVLAPSVDHNGLRGGPVVVAFLVTVMTNVRCHILEIVAS